MIKRIPIKELTLVTAAALTTLAVNEGYVETAYQDIAGVWTIGYGETFGVKKGDTTTPVRALIQLNNSASKHAKGAAACIEGVSLYQHEWDAYVDQAYHFGVPAFCSSTLVKKLKSNDHEGACKELLRWVKYKHWYKDDQGSWTYEYRVKDGLVKRAMKRYNTCMGLDNA